MVYKCASVGCKSGYSGNTNTEVSFHKFPFNKPDLLTQWVKKLSRSNFTPTKHSRICSLHFDGESFVTDRTLDSNAHRRNHKCRVLQKRYLRDDAVPSIFPNLPAYFSSPQARRSNPPTSESRRQCEITKNETITDDFLQSDIINSTKELAARINSCDIQPFHSTMLSLDTFIVFTIDNSTDIPRLSSSINFTSDLDVAVVVNSERVSLRMYNHLLTSGKVTLFSQVENLLALVKNIMTEKSTQLDWIDRAISNLQAHIQTTDDSVDCVENRLIEFVHEQLLLFRVSKNNRRYSSGLIVFSYLIFATSAAAYKALYSQGVLTLPSTKILSRLTRSVPEQTDVGCDRYLTMRAEKLKDYERNVLLMIDEIYVAKRVEYSGGKIYGQVSGQLVSTLLVFMIKSLCGKFRDVVGIFPIVQLNADIQYDAFIKVLGMVTNCGFSVLCLSVDNHSVNRKFYTQKLCDGTLKVYIPHPITADAHLFLVFDPTHNLKNIYNNFQTRRVFECPEYSGIVDAGCRASFDHVSDIFQKESNMPIRMAHKLNKTIMNPKSIEKTSVKLACGLFHESTRNALNYYGEQTCSAYLETAAFISVVGRLWSVLNVKTTSAGRHKRDIFRDPIFSAEDLKLSYLQEFAMFLKKWQDSGKRGLTAETFLSLRHTCETLVAFAKYLLEHKSYKYVLLGAIQSDAIESRFGWYRQLSGANYYISVRQVLENEQKIKAISLIKFSGFSPSEIRESLHPDSDIQDDSELKNTAESILATLATVPDVVPDSADYNIIYYVCGYICRSLCKRFKCDSCTILLRQSDVMEKPQFDVIDCTVVKFQEAIDRGGLSKPTDFLYTVCLKCWTLFSELKQSPSALRQFLSCFHSRQLFASIAISSIHNDASISDYVLGNRRCSAVDRHPVVDCAINSFYNCLAKNLVGDITHSQRDVNDSSRKRKVSKLTGKTKTASD